MRRYPIGPFLFWQVDPAHSTDFVFYEFMSRYHERLEHHNKRLDLPSPRPLVAILERSAAADGSEHRAERRLCREAAVEALRQPRRLP